MAGRQRILMARLAQLFLAGDERSGIRLVYGALRQVAVDAGYIDRVGDRRGDVLAGSQQQRGQ